MECRICQRGGGREVRPGEMTEIVRARQLLGKKRRYFDRFTTVLASTRTSITILRNIVVSLTLECANDENILVSKRPHISYVQHYVRHYVQ